MKDNYSIDATMVNGELIGTPKLTVPHHILLKVLDLTEHVQTLENKDRDAVDLELTNFIHAKVAKTVAKYNPNKRERKVASELKAWGDALLLLFYDLGDTDNGKTDGNSSEL